MIITGSGGGYINQAFEVIQARVCVGISTGNWSV